MTRWLVTGASGLLGLNFALQASGRHAVTGVVHRSRLEGAPFSVVTADFRRPEALEALLDQTRPDWIAHCAALAILDECEARPEEAWQLNAEIPGQLAELARRKGIGLLHISTDAVFDGVRGGYSEEDEPNPLSVYARSKLAGEQAVRQAYPDALVARVNFYGWRLRGPRSLAELFYNNLSAGRTVNGFTDALFSPLLVNDLADLLLEMAGRRLSGLYHVFSSETLSKYEFGRHIAAAFGFDPGLIRPVSLQESGLVAARSANLSMRTDKLAAALGRPLPGQDQGIRGFYELYRQGHPRLIRDLAGQPA